MKRFEVLFAIAVAALLALAMLSLPLGKLVLLLTAGIMALVVFAKPRLALYAFAFLAAFLPYSTITLGIRMTISEALLMLIWLAVIWDTLSPRLNWTLTPTHKAVLAMAVFSIIPFIWGQLFIQADGNGVVSWVRWLMNVSTLFLVTLLIENKRQLYTLLGCLVAGSVLMVLVSMGYFLKGFDARNFGDFLAMVRYGNPDAYMDIFSSFNQRMGSPWVHPNLLGGALALMLPVVFGWWLANRESSLRTVMLMVSGIILFGLLLSVSRGAILSIAIVVSWLALQGTPYAKRMLVMGLMVGIAAALFYPPIQERLTSTLSSVNASDNLRIAEYKAFPEAMMTYPLGIGFKTDPPPPGSELLGISNLWLNYVYKIGLVGMLLFVLALRNWWREVRPILRNEQHTGSYFLHQGVVAGIVAALLTGLVDHYYSFTNVLCGIFWLLIGISLLTAKYLREEQSLQKG